MRLRAPSDADAEVVCELLRACDIAQLGVPDTTLEDVIDTWHNGVIDLAADARIALLNEEIVGYAVVDAPGVMLSVSPAHEDTPVADALIDWTQARERAQGREEHRQWIAASNARARERLECRGYELVRSYFRMIIDVPVVPGGVEISAAPDASAAVCLRALDVAADAVELHALDAECFSERADYQPELLAHFVAEHLLANDVDPGLSRVAEEAGEIVGFAIVRRWDEDASGHVDLLAVAPRLQGGGLGSRLLHDVFAACAAAGLRAVHLGVASDNPGALRLYLRLGMKEQYRFDVYERPVD